MADSELHLNNNLILKDVYNIFTQITMCWLNIVELCKLNKFISIVKCDDGNENQYQMYAVQDFTTILVDCLIKTSPLSLILLTSSNMKKIASQNVTILARDPIQLRLLEKHLIFVVYDSLSQLNQSLYDEKWTIYRKSKKSEFMLFMMDKNINDIECDSEDFLERIKSAIGIHFENFWISLKLMEVIMVFPVLCDKQYVFKYDFLEAFANKEYSKGVILLKKADVDGNPRILLHDYSDFRKYPLKINAFERMPTMVRSVPGSINKTHMIKDIEHIGDLGGLDGFGMGNLVKKLNFEPIIAHPTDGGEYGYKGANGTFSGSMGDLISHRMDISMNARFIKGYGTDEIEFSSPVFYDQFCVVVPKSKEIPTWMSIFLVFSIPVWFVTGIIFILSGFVWWLMKAKFPEYPLKLSTTAQCFLFLDIFLVLTSQPWAVLPRIDRERFMLTLCLIFNLIFASLFQGYLSTAYSTTTFEKDVSTLEILDQSGLSISTKNVDIFGGADASSIGASLTKKIITSSNISIETSAYARTTSIVERKTDAVITIQLKYTRKDGQPLLHTVEECPRSYHLSYIVYKNFPLLKYINNFFQRTVEAGLNDKWYYDTEYSLLLSSRQKEEEGEKTRKLTLVDVQTSFWWLVISLTMSLIVFIGEVFIFYGGKCFKRGWKRKKSKCDNVKRKYKNVETTYPFVF